MASSEVKEFVHENNYLELFKDENDREKVRCKLTGHQLPCRLPDIITYTSGKKYQRLISSLSQKSQEKQFVPDDFKEYLEPSTHNKNQLYCKVTRKLINNIPHHIQKHVTGKRFQRQLKIYKEKESGSDEEENFWKPPSDSDSADEQEIDRLSDSFVDNEDIGDDDHDEKMDDSVDDDDTKEVKKKSNPNKDKDSSKDKNANKTRKRKVTLEKDEEKTDNKKKRSNKQTKHSKATKKIKK